MEGLKCALSLAKIFFFLCISDSIRSLNMTVRSFRLLLHCFTLTVMVPYTFFHSFLLKCLVLFLLMTIDLAVHGGDYQKAQNCVKDMKSG